MIRVGLNSGIVETGDFDHLQYNPYQRHDCVRLKALARMPVLSLLNVPLGSQDFVCSKLCPDTHGDGTPNL